MATSILQSKVYPTLGMPNAAKVFYEAYELFQRDPESFKSIKQDFYFQYGDI